MIALVPIHFGQQIDGNSHISVCSDRRTWCATQSSGGWGSFLAVSESSRFRITHTHTREGEESKRRDGITVILQTVRFQPELVSTASVAFSLISLLFFHHTHLREWSWLPEVWALSSVYYSPCCHERWWFYCAFLLFSFSLFSSLFPGDLQHQDPLRPSRYKERPADDHVSIRYLCDKHNNTLEPAGWDSSLTNWGMDNCWPTRTHLCALEATAEVCHSVALLHACHQRKCCVWIYHLPTYFLICSMFHSLTLFTTLTIVSCLCPHLPFHVLMWSKSCSAFNEGKEVCPLENLSDPLRPPAKTPAILPIQISDCWMIDEWPDCAAHSVGSMLSTFMPYNVRLYSNTNPDWPV